MILFQDYSIVIELMKDTNIMCVRFLDVASFKMWEFELSFHILMDKIEEQSIKKLLIHPCKTLINLPDDIFLSVITLLQSGFAHSGIEKIARISVDNSERDQQCTEHFKNLLNEMELKIAFRNFTHKSRALAWL